MRPALAALLILLAATAARAADAKPDAADQQKPGESVSAWSARYNEAHKTPQQRLAGAEASVKTATDQLAVARLRLADAERVGGKDADAYRLEVHRLQGDLERATKELDRLNAAYANLSPAERAVKPEPKMAGDDEPRKAPKPAKLDKNGK